jgi:hypothetical protein
MCRPAGELTLAQRLASGAAAGMTATALTHPLDTVRLRLALPTHPYRGEGAGACARGVPGSAVCLLLFSHMQ